MFAPTSRYVNLEIATLTQPDGTVITYVKRRFVPQPHQFDMLQEHVVSQGERLDRITASYFNDPELFWRICDANNALHPKEMTDTIGRRLRITLPEGIPGPRDA